MNQFVAALWQFKFLNLGLDLFGQNVVQVAPWHLNQVFRSEVHCSKLVGSTNTVLSLRQLVAELNFCNKEKSIGFLVFSLINY